MKKQIFMHQGDVTIHPFAGELIGEKVSHNGSLTLALGEATGHHHTITVPNIEDMDAVKLATGEWLLTQQKTQMEKNLAATWTREADKYLKEGGLLIVYHKYIMPNPNPDKYTVTKRVFIGNRTYHLPRVAIFFQKKFSPTTPDKQTEV